MNNIYGELELHQKNRLANKKDKRKFGLVLQGGGMRGAYTAGALAVLVEYGLTDCFDHIVGSSAGALNGAYYLAQDTDSLHHTYSDDLTNKNFVNLLRRDKIVDIDFLVDKVLKSKRTLDKKKLLDAKTKLHIMLTDAQSGKKTIISDHRAFAEIYEELRATAAVPLLYDKQVLVQGEYYIDGGVADNIPIDIAVDFKCTDIVVVLTQQLNSFDFTARHRRLEKHLVRRFTKLQSKMLKKKLPSDERITKINLRRLTHPTKKIRFYVLEPSNEEFLVSIGSTDKPKIKTLARLGVTDMDKFLHKQLGKQ